MFSLEGQQLGMICLPFIFVHLQNTLSPVTRRNITISHIYCQVCVQLTHILLTFTTNEVPSKPFVERIRALRG